jgi:hypothetical protein
MPAIQTLPEFELPHPAAASGWSADPWVIIWIRA